MLAYRVVVSCALLLLASCSAQAVTVSAPASVLLGQSFAVSHTTDAVNAGDRIGMFRNGSCLATNDCFYFAKSVTALSEMLTFAGITTLYPLSVEFRYLRGNSALATSGVCTLVADASLTVKPIYQPGEPVIVQYTTSPFHDADDYIGIFPADACNISQSCWYLKLAVPAGGSGQVNFLSINGVTPPLEIRYVMASTLIVLDKQSTRVQVLPGCPNDCNNYGQCVAGTCQCVPGLSGNCSFTSAWTTGWHGGPQPVVSTTGSADGRCPNDCSRHGICNEGQCSCFSGFLPPNCAQSLGAQVDELVNAAPVLAPLASSLVLVVILASFLVL